MNTVAHPTPATGAKNTAGRAAWICLAIAWLTFVVPIPGIGLFIGWPLNLVAFILAIVAMSKRGAFAGLWPLLASLVVSPIVYFIGVAILGGMLASGAAESTRQAEAARVAADDTAMAADSIAIDASSLWAAYDQNEIAADQQFKGKALRVTGTVESIASDFSDAPVVSLASGQMFQSVSATDIPPADAAALSKGQQITLNCIGAGEVIGSPSLRNCRLE